MRAETPKKKMARQADRRELLQNSGRLPGRLINPALDPRSFRPEGPGGRRFRGIWLSWAGQVFGTPLRGLIYRRVDP